MLIVGPATLEAKEQHPTLLRSDGGKEVLAAVHALEAATRTDLCDRTGLAWGTVGYHLHRMVRTGLVRRVEAAGKVRFVAAGKDPEEALRERFLQKEEVRRIVDLLQNGPLGPARIARVLGSPLKRTRSLLGRMEALGLLVSDGAYRPHFQLTSRASRRSTAVLHADRAHHAHHAHHAHQTHQTHHANPARDAMTAS